MVALSLQSEFNGKSGDFARSGGLYCVKTAMLFHLKWIMSIEIAKALETSPLVKPKVLVINGGDGTSAGDALTELISGPPLNSGDKSAPVAVLPMARQI